MSSSLTKILHLIDIPNFSDDVRLVVLDYLHFRETSDVINNNISYRLRLSLGLQEDNLCFQITLYNSTFNRIVSSFGIYCEEKAREEYGKLKENISSQAVFSCEDSAISETCGFSTCHRLYVFCPKDNSTIMISGFTECDSRWHGIRLYGTNKNAIVSDIIGKYYMTNIIWDLRIGQHYRQEDTFDDTLGKMKFLQDLASQHGMTWDDYKIDRIRHFEQKERKKHIEKVWRCFPESSDD